MWIAPRHSGEVVRHEGFLPLKAVRGSSRSTAGWTAEAANGASKATRSEAPQALQHYIALHKAAAVRYQLTQHPALTLRLAVASLIGGAGSVPGRVGDRPRVVGRP